MEANGCNSPEYKFNPSSSSNESTSLSGTSTSNNHLQNKGRDRKNGIKRKPYDDPREKISRSIPPKREQTGRVEDGKEMYTENQHLQTLPHQSQGQVSQPQQLQTMATPTNFSNYYYGNAEHFNADPSRRPYPMMQQFGLYQMNQWVNPMEGMSNNNMALNPASAVPGSNGMDMSSVTGTIMNSLPPYMMNMPTDPYGMMGGMGNFCTFPYINSHENLSVPIPVQKETINLTRSVLYAPNPNAPVPTLRARPVGCRTVFVGGLPEKITEEIVREAFEQYGEIVTIRMSKKNFCHIRFGLEEHVEKALYLSGFRMKIENKDESSYSGRLHVDYAIARDDEHDYNCAKRVAQRVARHKALKELETNDTSAPAIPLFSEAELQNLSTEFRNVNFKGGVQILVSWLVKGEVNKRNAGTFYSIIQSLNHHVRKLLTEKSKCEDELNNAKTELRQKMFLISKQFDNIEKVFEATKYPNVWDHFTKAQKKNIELWKKQTSEIKKANSDELIDDRVEDEMECSEGEGTECSNKDLSKKNNEKTEELHKKIEDLREQLASTLLDVEKVKTDRNKILDSLHQNFQKTLNKETESQKEVDKYRALWAAKSGIAKNETIPNCENNSDSSNSRSVVPFIPYKTESGTYKVSGRDACSVGLISAFLNLHPFGAHMDYICSYLVKCDASVGTRYVENLMKLFPTVFEENSTGIGATLEKNWTFLGFNSSS